MSESLCWHRLEPSCNCSWKSAVTDEGTKTAAAAAATLSATWPVIARVNKLLISSSYQQLKPFGRQPSDNLYKLIFGKIATNITPKRFTI